MKHETILKYIVKVVGVSKFKEWKSTKEIFEELRRKERLCNTLKMTHKERYGNENRLKERVNSGFQKLD